MTAPTYSPALAAEALALRQHRDSRLDCARGADTAPSPSAPSAADASLGQHGALVLRSLSTGGVVYGAGTFIPADICAAWKNKAALAQSRRVTFLKAPLATPAAEPDPIMGRVDPKS
ncbi:MAG: hypothetical protein ACLQJR_34620 [Stellaceae bacterium]